MCLLTKKGAILMRIYHRAGVASVVHFFVGVAELLLLLRVVLRFFNGNPNASFVHWCYTTTATLLEPLRAIFPSVGQVHSGWVVDFPALLAMAIYALAGYLVLGLVDRWVGVPSVVAKRR
jgi:uncharacterized protein YggT (Ycf19 family)